MKYILSVKLIIVIAINFGFVADDELCAQNDKNENSTAIQDSSIRTDFIHLTPNAMKEAIPQYLKGLKPGSVLYKMSKASLTATYEVKNIAKLFLNNPEKRKKINTCKVKYNLAHISYHIENTVSIDASTKCLSSNLKRELMTKDGALKWSQEGPYRGCFVIKPECTNNVSNYKQCNIIFKRREGNWEIVEFEIDKEFDGRWYWAKQHHEEISTFLKKRMAGTKKKILYVLPPGTYPQLNADQYAYYYTQYPRGNHMTPVPGKLIHVNSYLYWVTEDGFRMPVKMELVVGPENGKWLIKEAAIDADYCSKVAQQLRAARFIDKYVAMKNTNRKKYTCSWSKSFVTIPPEATIVPFDRARMVMSLDEGSGRKLKNSVKATKRWYIQFRARGVDDENVKQYDACIFLTNSNNYLVHHMYSR